MSTFLPTINILPSLNADGTYTLKVNAYELTEIMKGLRYMEKQRENNRKYKDKIRISSNRQPNQFLSLNIIPPINTITA